MPAAAATENGYGSVACLGASKQPGNLRAMTTQNLFAGI